MELTIDKLNFEDAAYQQILAKIDAHIDERVAEEVERIKKKYDFPLYMNKGDAAKYLGVAYNTMMNKYVPNGLKLTVVDTVVRISQAECDRFMKENQK
ncbi:MAG: hypothetical protein ACK5MW_04955 [Enterococcus sp.]